MVVDFEFPLFGLERASSFGMNTSRRATLVLGYNRPPKLSMGMGGQRDARILPLFLLFFIFLFLFLYFFSFFPYIFFSSRESF